MPHDRRFGDVAAEVLSRRGKFCPTGSKDARMNTISIESARPASEHLVSPSHHSYLIRSVSGSDELALFDMFARSSPKDLRLRCLGMIKDFPRLAAARLAHCDGGREIALGGGRWRRRGAR